MTCRKESKFRAMTIQWGNSLEHEETFILPLTSTENQSRGSAVVRHAFYASARYMWLAGGRPGSKRSDEKGLSGVHSSHLRCGCWPRAFFRMTFFAERMGKGQLLPPSKVATLRMQHLTYCGRNISPAYFRDRVATRFASGLLPRVRGTGVGPEVPLGRI